MEVAVLLECWHIDVLAITEHHLAPGVKRDIPGYVWVAGPARLKVDSSGYCRGVGLYLRDSFRWELIPHSGHEAMFPIRIVRVDKPNRGICVGAFYCPPSSRAVREECFNVLQQFVDEWVFSNNDLVILGDFNPVSVGGSIMADFLVNSGMKCVNSFGVGKCVDGAEVVGGPLVSPVWADGLMVPTSLLADNVLDCALVSEGLVSSVVEVSVLDGVSVGGSPHRPLLVRFDFKCVRSYSKPQSHCRRYWKDPVRLRPKERAEFIEEYRNGLKAELQELEMKCSTALSCGHAESSDIDVDVDSLSKVLFSVARKLGREGVYRGTSCPTKSSAKPWPWFDAALADLVRARNNVSRRLQQAKRSRPVSVQRVECLEQLLLVVKRKVRRAKKDAKRSRWQAVVRSLDISSDLSFWKYIRRFRQRRGGLPPQMVDKHGDVVISLSERLKLVAEFWQSVYDADKWRSKRWDEDAHVSLRDSMRDLVDETKIRPEDRKSDWEEVIDGSAVERAVSRVALGKAPGLDGVHPWMIKMGGPVLVPVLTLLFKRMWKAAYIPVRWKQCVIRLLFKKGDVMEPGNYRPISLLSVVGKLLSRVLSVTLEKLLERSGCIPDEQGGFRRKRGCPELILALRSLLETRRRRRRGTVVAFLDIQKAYDSVNRDALILRLFELDSPVEIILLLRSWYEGDEACIAAEGSQSNRFKLSLGVKQGDVISPLLFSCYFSELVYWIRSTCKENGVGLDLGDGFDSVAILLYADDVVLFAESVDDMQILLDTVTVFLDERRLKVGIRGVDKSAVMFYGPNFFHSIEKGRSLSVCDVHLPVTDWYRYLGVIIENDGRLSRHFSALRSSLGLRVHDMIRAGMHGYGLAARRCRMLFMGEILPVMEYASAAWLDISSECVGRRKPSELLMRMWNKALRASVGVPSFVSVESVQADMDLIGCDPQARWLLYRICMMRKILLMEEDRVVKRCVSLWKSDHRVSGNWWSRTADDISVVFRSVVEDRKNEGRSVPEDRAEVVLLPELDPKGSWPDMVRGFVWSWARRRWWSRVKSKSHLAVFSQEFALYMQSVKCLRERRSPARLQSYLKDPSTCAMRKQFEVMLRAGSLPLQVCKPSAGFVKLVLQSKKCFMCEEAEESLQHFAFECPSYVDIRRKYGFLTLGCCSRSVLSIMDAVGKLGSEKGFKKVYVDMWFEMWCFRIKNWRKNHPDEDVGCLSARRNTYFSR